MNFGDCSEEEELVRELLNDDSPLFVSPELQAQSQDGPSDHQEAIKRLIPTVYLGPTIRDIESALFFSSQNKLQNEDHQSWQQQPAGYYLDLTYPP